MEKEIIKKKQAELEVKTLHREFKRLQKKADVDKFTKEYWSKYFGEYGKQLSKDPDEIAPQTKKRESEPKSPGWEGYTGYKEMSEKKSGVRIATKLMRIANSTTDSRVRDEVLKIVKILGE